MKSRLSWEKNSCNKIRRFDLPETESFEEYYVYWTLLLWSIVCKLPRSWRQRALTGTYWKHPFTIGGAVYLLGYWGLKKFKKYVLSSFVHLFITNDLSRIRAVRESKVCLNFGFAFWSILQPGKFNLQQFKCQGTFPNRRMAQCLICHNLRVLNVPWNFWSVYAIYISVFICLWNLKNLYICFALLCLHSVDDLIFG